MTREELYALKVGDRVALLADGNMFKKDYEGTVVAGVPSIEGILAHVLMDRNHNMFHTCRGHTPDFKDYNLWEREHDLWRVIVPVSLKDQIQTLWEGALL